MEPRKLLSPTVWIMAIALSLFLMPGMQGNVNAQDGEIDGIFEPAFVQGTVSVNGIGSVATIKIFRLSELITEPVGADGAYKTMIGGPLKGSSDLWKYEVWCEAVAEDGKSRLFSEKQTIEVGYGETITANFSLTTSRVNGRIIAPGAFPEVRLTCYRR